MVTERRVYLYPFRRDETDPSVTRLAILTSLPRLHREPPAHGGYAFVELHAIGSMMQTAETQMAQAFLDVLALETDVTADAVRLSLPRLHRESTAHAGYASVQLKPVDSTPSLVMMQTAEMQMAQALLDALALNETEVAQILGISEGQLRLFLVGRAALSARTEDILRETHATLQRLLRIFRRRRLAQAVRRPAPAFGNQTGLELIVDGRIAEVADTYERALSYQA